MSVLGGLAFGLIIGYLSWHAVRPEERKVDLKTVGAVIGVVAGATIKALFPTGSEYLTGYLIGLSIGFFVPAIFKIIEMSNLKAEREIQKQKARETELEAIRLQNIEKKKLQEKEYISSNWVEIKKQIQAVADNALELSFEDLKFIDFTDNKETKELLLERFALESQKQWHTYKNPYDIYYPYTFAGLSFGGEQKLRMFNVAKTNESLKEVETNWKEFEKYIDSLLVIQSTITQQELYFAFKRNFRVIIAIMEQYTKIHIANVVMTGQGIEKRN